MTLLSYPPLTREITLALSHDLALDWFSHNPCPLVGPRYEVRLEMDDLPALFKGREELLDAGHKHDLCFQLCKMLFFALPGDGEKVHHLCLRRCSWPCLCLSLPLLATAAASALIRNSHCIARQSVD